MPKIMLVDDHRLVRAGVNLDDDPIRPSSDAGFGRGGNVLPLARGVAGVGHNG
mgnify:CR=1 FL=1